jgi:hypothetical protein
MKAKKIFSFMTFLFVIANFAHGICLSNLKTGVKDEPNWLFFMEKGDLQLFYAVDQEGNEKIKAVNSANQPLNIVITLDSGVQYDRSGYKFSNNKEYTAELTPLESSFVRIEGFMYSISDLNGNITIN